MTPNEQKIRSRVAGWSPILRLMVVSGNGSPGQSRERLEIRIIIQEDM